MEILHGVTERGAGPIIQRWAISKLTNRRLPALLDAFVDGNQYEVRYAGRYLAKFVYGFNRCCELADLVPRLVYVAIRTPPLSDRLLTLSGTTGQSETHQYAMAGTYASNRSCRKVVASLSQQASPWGLGRTFSRTETDSTALYPSNPPLVHTL